MMNEPLIFFWIYFCNVGLFWTPLKIQHNEPLIFDMVCSYDLVLLIPTFFCGTTKNHPPYIQQITGNPGSYE